MLPYTLHGLFHEQGVRVAVVLCFGAEVGLRHEFPAYAFTVAYDIFHTQLQRLQAERFDQVFVCTGLISFVSVCIARFCRK